jgi:glycopeptide antibiotics resistance protein
MNINTQAIKDNIFNIAGVLVGLTALKITGLGFTKFHRSDRFY